MKQLHYFAAVLLLLMSSCNYRESAYKDLSTGLSVKGSGLGYGSVYLTSDDEKISRNAFTHGERISVHFDGVEGFIEKKGRVYPKMSMLVVSKNGDTLFYNPEVYKDSPEMPLQNPVSLTANLTVARPIHSGDRCKLIVKISDGNGKGAINAEMPFTVKPSVHLHHKVASAQYDEIYLFDSQANTAVTTDHFPRSHKMALIYEGLSGFSVSDSLCNVGLSLKITDRNGVVLLDEQDLAADQPVSNRLLEEQFYATFTTGTDPITNPVTIKAVIWDKTGKAKIVTTGSFNLENN